MPAIATLKSNEKRVHKLFAKRNQAPRENETLGEGGPAWA